MASSVVCPNPDCAGKFAVKPEHAGKRIKCPKCGEPIQVPRNGAAAAAPAPARGPAPAAARTPAPNREERRPARREDDYDDDRPRGRGRDERDDDRRRDDRDDDRPRSRGRDEDDDRRRGRDDEERPRGRGRDDDDRGRGRDDRDDDRRRSRDDDDRGRARDDDYDDRGRGDDYDDRGRGRAAPSRGFLGNMSRLAGGGLGGILLWVGLGSLLMLLVCVFLPWVGASGFGISISVSGMDTGMTGLMQLMLAPLALAFIIVAVAMNNDMLFKISAWVGGGVGALLGLWRLLNLFGGGAQIGLFLSLVFGLLAGGTLMFIAIMRLVKG